MDYSLSIVQRGCILRTMFSLYIVGVIICGIYSFFPLAIPLPSFLRGFGAGEPNKAASWSHAVSSAMNRSRRSGSDLCNAGIPSKAINTKSVAYLEVILRSHR